MDAILQNINLENLTQSISDPIIAAILAVLGVVGIVVGIIFLIGIYIYFALALSTIAKKIGYTRPWLAWIPVANLFLFPILTGRKWAWGLLFFVPVVNVVFLIICLWKMLEREGHDGKWSLILLGNLLAKPNFIVFVSFLGILGVLAWKKK
jgi:hypothetical protein